MRRWIWVWVVVAFLVGLVPGVTLLWLERGSYISARTQLLSRNAQLRSETQSLTAELRAAEASLSALTAKFPAPAPVPQTPNSLPTTPSTSAQPTGVPTVTDRSVSPDPVSGGGKLTLTVKVTGHADKVDMRIATANGSFDKTYFLARTGSDATGETWSKAITAPATAGTYRFFAIAIAGTTRYPQAGIKTFVVK